MTDRQMDIQAERERTDRWTCRGTNRQRQRNRETSKGRETDRERQT